MDPIDEAILNEDIEILSNHYEPTMNWLFVCSYIFSKSFIN